VRKCVVLLLVIFAFDLICVFFAFRTDTSYAPDAVEVNDVVMSALQNTNQTEVVDVISGYLFHSSEEMEDNWQKRDTRLKFALFTTIVLVTATGGVLLWYIHRSILAPFNRLNHFAERIAAGDLEIPLAMDKGSNFGAFTESFDLMRAELARAREAERQANQSKKELVASLSHDIKTPVASIKATSELMAVTASGEKEQRQLEIISTKADQIDLLITNMFTAALEELQELTVTLQEVPSTVLAKIIRDADYRQKLSAYAIPECLILADAARLAQVIDNIFINSYKYADTDIDITATIEEDCLCIKIADHGNGVLPEELPLITQKFYRGNNAKEQSGTGLGLYISKYFIEKMAGSLHCSNGETGFTVLLTLNFA